MKKILLLLLLFAGMANAQIINFPDPVFKAKLLAADAANNIAANFFGSTKIDINNDGEIDVNEAVEIYSLQIGNSGITDLTGISAFTSLQTLYCENNLLTSLDASNLSSLVFLSCANNQLASLNVNGMFNLESLSCDANQLTSLNLSGQGLSGLRSLGCSNNQLTSLTISGVTALESLNCSENLLTVLSVSGLGNLKFINCGDNKLTAFSVASLTHMEILWCYNNLLTTLNLTGAMTSFHELNCSTNQLTTLNIPTLVNLAILRCTGNQLSAVNTTNLVNLKTYQCDNNLMTTLNVTGLPLLEGLSCSYNQITSLNVTNLANLKGLGCNNNLLTTVDFTGVAAMENLNFSYNTFPTADLTVMPNLKEISCYNNQLTSLNVSGLANAEQILCMNNLLPALNLSGLTNLKVAWCGENLLTSLNVSGLTNLIQLDCSHNQLPTLNVSGLTNLFSLQCANNLLPVLDVSGLSALVSLGCADNLLTALDVSGLNILGTLSCADNAIQVLDVSGMVSIENLYCGNNQIAALDLTGFVNLRGLLCDGNLLTTLDVSDCSSLVENYGISCTNNLLTTLFVKNGRNEYVACSGNPNLTFICGDEGQIATLQLASTFNNSNTVVSSYCSFTPGGSYNSVTGTARFDIDNNGCTATDIGANNVRFDLTDNTISSGTFANYLGNYVLYAAIGNYTLTANLENPAYFNITPTTATFNFPALDSSIQTQDFCLTPNGAHPDLEIVLTPSGIARPGFDALYQVVYKNKGNQTLSGTVNLVFDDAKTDFVSATPAVNNQTVNSLIWNYTDLQPFESRVIYFTLNINSPTEIPAVVSGNILDFTASINFASGDDTPNDNIFVLHQTVLNAMDPNIKTCLEGNVVSPSEIGNYLHYNIEFENLGTAEATNVVVRDIIDTTMFDINTLQVLYNSHPMRASISGNKIEFVFKNINLAPATGNPPVGGHGSILFKIRTLPTLTEGDEVSNTAHIFFDYNTPIVTNEERTAFQSLGVSENNIDKTIVVYPNPAKNNVNINCSNAIKTIELYDIQGRILQTVLANGKSEQLDISNQSNGIYFIKVTTDYGMKAVKLVKE